MCGRYTLTAGEEEIIQEFSLDEQIPDYQPSFNVAPGQQVLAIIHDGEKKRAGYLRWGLVPSWAKDEKIGCKMINARSETAHEKASFKRLMARKRCLIAADSFYEWRKTDYEKQPKRIQLPDRRLYAFARLWDKWQGEEETLFTCTILTKGAHGMMKNIHHRMPVILPKDKEAEWIKPVKTSVGEAQQFLQNLDNPELTAYDVADYVNKPKNNDSQCIAPLI